MPHLSDDAESTQPSHPNYPPPPYRLDVRSVGPAGACIARIAGDLDYVVTPALRRRLLEELPGIEMFIVDLSQVTLLSAAALEMLLDLDDMSVAHGVHVRVVAATRAALRPLQLTGIDRRLSLYPSVAAALDMG